MEFIYTRNGEITALVFDAVIEALHEATAQATDHRVARGVDITDHITHAPERLSAQVFVTNTPILAIGSAQGSVSSLALDVGGVLDFRRYAKAPKQPAQLETTPRKAAVSVLQFTDPPDRVREVLDLLHTLKEEGTIFTIVTSHREYPAMLLLGISDAKTAKTGDAAQIDLTFRQVRFADSATVAAEPLETRAEREQARGGQDTEEAEGREASLWFQLSESLGGIL